jgi:hypothetical protein
VKLRELIEGKRVNATLTPVLRLFLGQHVISPRTFFRRSSLCSFFLHYILSLTPTSSAKSIATGPLVDRWRMLRLHPRNDIERIPRSIISGDWNLGIEACSIMFNKLFLIEPFRADFEVHLISKSQQVFCSANRIHLHVSLVFFPAK